MKLFAKALVETTDTGFVLEDKPHWVYGRLSSIGPGTCPQPSKHFPESGY